MEEIWLGGWVIVGFSILLFLGNKVWCFEVVRRVNVEEEVRSWYEVGLGGEGRGLVVE